MKKCSNAACGYALCTLSAVVLAITQCPPPAAAFHVIGVSVSPVSINSTTRTVTVNIAESTVGSGFPHSQAVVHWGDAVTSAKAWTANSGAGPIVYRVDGVSHVYPDLTDRTITVFGDCCNTALLTPTNTLPVQLGCADTPKFGCNATATKAQLQLKAPADDTKDKLKFKWQNGNVLSFDDPTGSVEYYLCIYAPTLILQAVVPPGANWKATGSGFKYGENTGAAGGVSKIKIQKGAGTAKIFIKGFGMNLDDPALPLTQPVLVQVQNSNGSCWEHQFTSPENKNTMTQFNDHEP
jgi:hypothetical protein